MSRYKFKIGEKVYFKNENHSFLVVKNRKTENNVNVYELICYPFCRFKFTYRSWTPYRNKITKVLWYCNKLFLKAFPTKIYNLNKDSFEGYGFMNYPRIDNFIQEDRLTNKEYVQEQTCQTSDCNWLVSFLEDKVYNVNLVSYDS